ncbi:MAG: 1-deoxy-D-xylulose-5-phosphate reductoisomerase, partial [Roseivirga sp.]
MSEKKHIAILGSTGSIGTQALDVIRANQDKFVVEVLTAMNNSQLLIEQAKEFKPNTVVITNESLYDQVFDALDALDIKVYAGANALNSVVQMESIDLVLTALVGYAGLKPTISAIESGKNIAL